MLLGLLSYGLVAAIREARAWKARQLAAGPQFGVFGTSIAGTAPATPERFDIQAQFANLNFKTGETLYRGGVRVDDGHIAAVRDAPRECKLRPRRRPRWLGS